MASIARPLLCCSYRRADPLQGPAISEPSLSTQIRDRVEVAVDDCSIESKPRQVSHDAATAVLLVSGRMLVRLVGLRMYVPDMRGFTSVHQIETTGTQLE